MEVIYHELAVGKDSGLSQILAAWSKTYEERYEALKNKFAHLIQEIDDTSKAKRPRSAQFGPIELSDFREQFHEVLQLRATLSVEVEALQQLRAELEDSESLSEVHIQLERATVDNRRLQAAIRVAHEQISDLYFNKRVLEAEMSALRSDRDRQLAEANERVRLAERAVVAAATSRRRIAEPIATTSPVLGNRSGARSGAFGSLTESTAAAAEISDQSDGSGQHLPTSVPTTSSTYPGLNTSGMESGPTTAIARASMVSKPKVTKLRQPLMGFKIAGQKAKDCTRFKNYATLTAMSFEEFDSLDEDDMEDADNDDEDDDVGADQHRNKTEADMARSSVTESSQVDDGHIEKSPEKVPSIAPVVPISDTADVPTSQVPISESVPDTGQTNLIAQSQITDQSDTSPLFVATQPARSESPIPLSMDGTDSAAILSPTSSSTPRKSLPTHDTAASSQPQTPLLKDLSTDWQTAIVPADLDTVPRADYLRLLDELDAVRQELELARRQPPVVVAASATGCITDSPVSVMQSHAPAPDNHISSQNFDLGLTEQLRDLADKVQETPIAQEATPTKDQRTSLLPPSGPGTTRLFDWSVSPNQSSCSIGETPTVDKVEEPVDEDQTPIRPTQPTPCAICLQREAKRIVDEVVASSEHEENMRITLEHLTASERRVKQLEDELKLIDVKASTSDAGVQFDGLSATTPCRSVGMLTERAQKSRLVQTTHTPLSTSEVQTEPAKNGLSDSGEGLAFELRRYSKLSADAACICLALAQRLASLNHRGVPDGEQSMESAEDFNQLLSALSGQPSDNDETNMAMYRSGYKILAPALTQLNQEVERLASALDADSIGHTNHANVSVSCSGDELNKDAEISELRNRLSMALQLLAEQLPVDTRKALADTTQLVETERLQLQAELERRMVLFEQNHTSSLTELETSRRALVDQLANSEVVNMQLRDELAVLTQKLQAKERFLIEQTDERELEREEFRAEVQRLESQLQLVKSQLLTSKIVNGNAAPEVNDSAVSPITSDPIWFTDSSDTESKTPVKSRSVDCRVMSKLTIDTSGCGVSKYVTVRRNTWADRLLDDDDSLEYGTQAFGARASVPAPIVEHQATWVSPDLCGKMTNNSNATLLIDDLEPYSETQESADAQPQPTNLRASTAPHVISSACGVTDSAKSLEHKAIQTSVELYENDTQTQPYACLDAWTETDPDRDWVDLAAPNSTTTTRRTTTTRTTLDTVAAAALLGRIAVTTEEESTVITTSDAPGAQTQADVEPANATAEVDVLGLLNLLQSKDAELTALRQKLARAQTVDLNNWTEKEPKIPASTEPQPLDDGNSDSLKLHHSWSTPSLTSPSTGSTAGDTGVEMSHGMTMIDSLESGGCVLNDFHSDNSLVKHNNSSARPGADTLHLLLPDPNSPWTSPTSHPTVTPVTDDTRSHESTVIQADPVLDAVEEGASWSAVSSLEPTPKSVMKTFQEQKQQTSLDFLSPDVEQANVACDTADLDVELIPSSDLEKLIGQKEASDVVIGTMRAEIDSLLKYQHELEADYSTVQSMLDDRQAEIDRHTQEILTLQDRCMALDRQVNDRKNVIMERDEDLFLLTEEKETLQAKVAELEKELESLRSGQNTLREQALAEVEVQTTNTSLMMCSTGTMVTQSMLAGYPLDVLDRATSCELENADTIQDDASSIHSLNVAEAEDLVIDAHIDRPNSDHSSKLDPPQGVRGWITSTPDNRSTLLGPLSPRVELSMESEKDVVLPKELKTLVKRLREESLRLFSLASACQPSAAIWPDSPRAPNTTEEPTVLPLPEPSTDIQPQDQQQQLSSPPVAQHQPSVVADLVRANTALKTALHSLAQTVESYELPGSDPISPARLSKDHVHSLVRCTADALASDELVWLGMLDWSLCQTAGRVCQSLRPRTEFADSKVQQFVWNAIGRLVDQLSAFMRQEDKYRECLVQAHLVEQQCLSSELQTALNRSNNLSDEVGRLTERLASHKEALTRADSLNLRLANQVNNLKTELVSVTDELHREKSTAEQAQANSEQLSARLSEQQKTVAAMRAQLETVNTDKSNLAKERADLTKALQELTESLTEAHKQIAEIKAQWKEASNALGKAVHSAQMNKSSSFIESSLGSQPGVSIGKSSNHRDDRHSEAASDDLFHAISRAATNLAVARHTANKAERRARELQATNQSLRLSLAETELRLMPLLVTVTNRDQHNPEAVVSNPPGSPVRDLTQPTTSSRFSELKGMCTRLLSLASAEDRESPSCTDSSNEDEDGPQASALNSSKPSVRYGSKNRLDPDPRVRPAERDAGPNTTTTNNMSNTQSPLKTTNVNSSSGRPVFHIPLEEQTVSMERFRNLHTRYLRSESYRRALAFQKRYLLLLLGGFQYSEETVLASICRPDSTVPTEMTASSDGFPSPGFRTVPLRRFRVVVRAIQVIHRMRQMLNRWRRSGLHCPPGRGPIERTAAPDHRHAPSSVSRISQHNYPAHLGLPQLVESSTYPYSELPVRTPLRELDVDLLGSGASQRSRAPSTSSYPFRVGSGGGEFHDAFSPIKAMNYPNQPQSLFTNPAPHYSPTTSSPVTPQKQHMSRSTPGKPSASRSSEWAVTSTNTSQLVIRSDSSSMYPNRSSTSFDGRPTHRPNSIAWDAHSSRVHSGGGAGRSRLSLTANTSTALSNTIGERRRSATGITSAQCPTTPRNGPSFTRLDPNTRGSIASSRPTTAVAATARPTVARPCRQPPFK